VTVVLVDARNVLRSRWPNVPEAELVERVRTWAERAGLNAVIVFDGQAPEGGVGTKGESADDWIARAAAELEEPYWLVTSDRELRERAGGRAERTIGGGAFLGELGLAG
jgi:predicted RNA-binding protein with PIN domain